MALRIVGAGLGRTGTASLKIALEQLGVGRCYHMSEVGNNPAHVGLWLEAANGKPDWVRLLGDYGADGKVPARAFSKKMVGLRDILDKWREEKR